MHDNRSPRVLLQQTGKQFAEPHRTALLTCGLEVDAEVLQAIGTIYAKESMRNQLEQLGAHVGSLKAAFDVIEHASQHGTVWGVSGFATPSTREQPLDYIKEDSFLSAIYLYLSNAKRRPSLVVDGGCSQGVLGLNGLFARLADIPCLGYIPYEGFVSIGARRHMVAWGDTYEDRKVLVGTTPHVLLCIGGARATIDECMSALLYKTPVILVEARPYNHSQAFTNVYTTIPRVQQAMKEGRFFFCRELGEVHEAINKALAYSYATRSEIQAARLADLAGYLGVRR